ncbi:hypothetical protein BR93DRAFT_965526 [Coniochaeta sp. PMI_546]|nr:hypothetical protein BR93DRAFT_965526 [Coniochaeta sp. PMI_546]
MPTGRCLCGKIRIQLSDAPKRTALCHCDTCRHYTGSVYSFNIVVPGDSFVVSHGQPKEVKLTADSGRSITNCFCGDCGTTVYRYGDSFGGIDGDKIVQGGVLDKPVDLDANRPQLEMFVEDRIKWAPSLDKEGADQFKGMPPSPPIDRQ